MALPMTHHDDLGGADEARVSYEWNRAGRSNQLAVHVSGSPHLPDEEGEEPLITEHGRGYGLQRNGTTLEYEVEHPRWRVWRASQAKLDCDAIEIYGADLAREKPDERKAGD